MIFIGIIASIAAIVVLCCVLFYLAVYALPLFAGVTVGAWAYGTGAGWLGGIAVGFIAALVTLGVGHVLLVFVKPLWLRLVIAIAFVTPAAIAGYHTNPRHRETHHAVRNVADDLLCDRRHCSRRHRICSRDDVGRDRALGTRRHGARLSASQRRGGRARLVYAISSSVGGMMRHSTYR